MNSLKPWEVYNNALLSIPAYKLFLKSHLKKIIIVKDISTFQSLPVMTKSNYFKKYPLKKFFKQGRLPELGYASSGSTGEASYWFRGSELDGVGVVSHEAILRDSFKIKPSEPTLVLVCFSMGVWVAGMYTSEVFRKLSGLGWNICTMTPAIDRVTILKIFKTLKADFKNIVLCGYPPFLMNLLKELKDEEGFRKINWYVLTAGDKHSEVFREEMLQLTKNSNLNSVVGVYGSSDAGPIAIETPMSIHLRRIAQEDSEFRKWLMGDLALDPAVFQYDPRFIYLETLNDELLITSATASPLVRYNIRDRVRIFQVTEIKEKLSSLGIFDKKNKELLSKFSNPVLVMGGRNDVGITYYAMNLTAEQLMYWRNDKRFHKVATGNFTVYKNSSNLKRGEELYFNIQLLKGFSKKDKKIILNLEEKLHKSLIEVSLEYKKLCESSGSSVFLKVKLLDNHNKLEVPSGLNGLVFEEGKKTKVIF